MHRDAQFLSVLRLEIKEEPAVTMLGKSVFSVSSMTPDTPKEAELGAQLDKRMDAQVEAIAEVQLP